MRSLITYLSILLFIAWTLSCENANNKGSKKSLPKQPETSNSKRNFEYEPPKPVNGDLSAAIELGSLGLNYFIVSIDISGNWMLEKSVFGRSNIIYGANNTQALVKEILDFRNRIKAEGVEESNIHIIASSSVVKIEDISKFNNELAKSGLKIRSIDPEKEAKYALKATIPKEFTEESFLVDIGSGNSKLSWIENDDTLSIEIHGSKYFLSGVQDTTVFREVRNALLEVPTKNRNLCFILGGMIYEFLKDEIQSSKKRYFVLKPPGVYPRDNEKLKAGNVIYSALYHEPTYSYIFDSESNFSIGYLLEINNR